MTPVQLTVVDAFTAEPFRGNPAAVCVLDGPADQRWMQQLAAEMNLSETAFLHPEGDGWALRWFTPTTEVDLCGHATLAAAHVLLGGDEDRPGGDRLRFHTRSGVLTASRTGDDRIELDFPASPAGPVDPPAGLVEALGTEPVVVAATGATPPDLLVELASEEMVRSLTPDLRALAALDIRALIATAPAGADRDMDVVSRVFAPRFGIDEDPVTGSAHCTIGPWWQDRLGTVLVCHQASARGGGMTVTTDGERVRLAGAAVSVLRSTLLA